MRCDTCQQDAPVVMRVVIAKGYNRMLARAVYNCPACFERKERAKAGARAPSQASPSSTTTARPKTKRPR